MHSTTALCIWANAGPGRSHKVCKTILDMYTYLKHIISYLLLARSEPKIQTNPCKTIFHQRLREGMGRFFGGVVWIWGWTGRKNMNIFLSTERIDNNSFGDLISGSYGPGEVKGVVGVVMILFGGPRWANIGLGK